MSIEQTKNIIIVDDHSLVRNSLKMYLESTNKYIVDGCFENGLKGLQHLEKNECDLVIMDIEMPEMDGIQALRSIKKLHPKTPVLMLSFYNNLEMQHMVMEEGAAGVLCKSVELSELDNVLDCIFVDGLHIPFAVGKYMVEKSKNKLKKLEPKEIKLIELLIKELRIEEIALELNMTKRSAENLKLKIKEKIGVRTTYGLIDYAIKNGITYFTSN